MKNQTLAEQRRQLQKTAGLLNETFLGFGNFHKINELGMTAMGEDETSQGKYTIFGRTYDQVTVGGDYNGSNTATVTFENYNDDQAIELELELNLERDKSGTITGIIGNLIESGTIALDTDGKFMDGQDLSDKQIAELNGNQALKKKIEQSL